MGLWVPKTAFPDEKVYRCTTPGCDLEFPEAQKQQWRRHVIACDRKNEEVAQAELAKLEESSFTSVRHSDEEQFAFIRKRAAQGQRPKKSLIGV